MPPKLRPPQTGKRHSLPALYGAPPPGFHRTLWKWKSALCLPAHTCRRLSARLILRRPFPSSRAFSISRLLYTLPRGFVKGILGETLLFFVFPKAQGVKTSPSQVFSCTLDSFFKPQKGRGPFAPPANIISPESDCRRQRRCRCCESSRP